jgi:hypothetical protein
MTYFVNFYKLFCFNPVFIVRNEMTNRLMLNIMINIVQKQSRKKYFTKKIAINFWETQFHMYCRVCSSEANWFSVEILT